MNHNSALQFLRNYQPLPPDDSLSQEIISEYDAVRKYFKNHPDKKSLNLLLGSFGKGDGLGVYQLVEDTILAHHEEDVISALDLAIKTGLDQSKYWSIQIAANYSDERLLDGLRIALDHPVLDIRESTITALESIGGDKVVKILKERLLKEENKGVDELIKNVLSELDN